MKKLYTLAVGALIGAGAIAQTPQDTNLPKHKTQKATQQEVEMSNRLGDEAQRPFDSSRDTELFYEDFANGFDGNNEFGAWSISDIGTGEMDVWQVADENSPAGEFSTNIGPLESETADNGWVIFDADFYNTPVADGVEDLTGTLTSPEMDLSGTESVKIAWDQYFRYCCFSPSPLTVEVSTDGGSTWSVFPAHGDFLENANEASPNPFPTQVDISCAAAGESSVIIRFGYDTAGNTGYSHYYWGIDDVRIFETDVVNDLRVTQVTNGDVLNIYEYWITPLDQAIPVEDGGLYVGTMYQNYGQGDQENSVFTIEILNEGGDVIHTASAEPFLIPSFANDPTCPNTPTDTIYIETGWVPTEAGEYTVRTTVESDATDEMPEDNTMEKTIEYTTNPGIMGHDYVPLLDNETTMREFEDDPSLWEPEGWGNAFTFVNENTTVWGASVRFGETTDPEAFYNIQLIQFDPAEGVNGAGAQPVATTAGIVEDFMIPTSLEMSEPTWLLFEDENSDIFTGEFYYLGVFNNQPAAEALTFYGMSNSDSDFSSGAIDQSGAGDFIWFLSRTFTPAIRLITDEFVSVDEVSTQNGFHMGQNHPNPAVETTKIPFNLDQASEVRFEVYDITGKLVKTIDEGQVAAGNQFIQMDVNGLDAGIYSYTMIVDGKFTSTKKMVIQ
ncbi:T9SS type A sorting domain-containing protein [Halocola ammonii]